MFRYGSQETQVGTPTKPTGLLPTGCGPSYNQSEKQPLSAYTSHPPHAGQGSQHPTSCFLPPISKMGQLLPLTHLTASGELREGGRKPAEAKVPDWTKADMAGQRWAGGGGSAEAWDQ